MSNPKYSRLGPESDEYNRLKGRPVRIWPQGVTDVHATWLGRLVWVDLYTLGVAMNPNDLENVSIVYKAGIRIERIPGIEVSVELDRCIRYLIGQITEMDPTWSLERDPA